MSKTNQTHKKESANKSLFNEVTQLKEEIEHLKRKQEDEGKGFSGFLKRWGGVLAFIAAIFAVPHGAIDLYNSITKMFSKPNTQLYKASEVEWLFEPETKKLELSFPLVISNDGEGYDEIEGADAKLEKASSKTTPLVQFDRTAFSCSESGEPKPLPVYLRIESASQKNLQCTLKGILNDDSAKIFLGSNLLRLAIELRHKTTKPLASEMCFMTGGDITGDAVDPICMPGDTQ